MELLLAAAAGLCAFTPPRPDHVVIVVEENHGYPQIIGAAEAPYINSLANAGANFSSFYAITIPSQPNYLHFFSGSNQGETNNSVPADGSPYFTPNLGAELLAAGFTFIGYADGLPAAGSTVGSSDAYRRKHNPWVNWQGFGPNQVPPTVNQPFTAFPTDFSTLPTVAIVVPDMNNGMHDGTIAQADAWLLANISAYADWCMTHNSLLIITWDESNFSSCNNIPTIFYGPMVRRGTITSTWTLHNLLRTIEDMYGTGHAGAAANMGPIVGAFNDDPTPTSVVFRRGLNGYAGVTDTWIEESAPETPHASDIGITSATTPPAQALVKFDGIIGNAPGQVPARSQIVTAKLLLFTGTATADASVDRMSVHKLLAPWSGTSTWSSLGNGVSADGTEAEPEPDYAHVPSGTYLWSTFEVTRTVQEWANDPSSNQGWVVMPSGTDAWRILSSDHATVAYRPRLDVTYLRVCLGDFNSDGGIDGADVEAFYVAWESGDSAADVNLDGGIDGADVQTFFAAWEGGC